MVSYVCVSIEDTHREFAMGKLNDKAVAAKQPQEKQYAVADGDGLTLVVKPNETKLWCLRHRFGGKAKTLSLGIYPVAGLKQVRDWGLDARKLLAGGVDPGTNQNRSICC